jgi:CRP-like cAMP-binding protein/Fe-S-cluster-containing dehydrogenase component/thioredoxin reductase
VTAKYEIAIVGAGPAGMAAAIQAASENIPHILLERAEVANTIYKYGKGKHVMAEPSSVPLHEHLEMSFEATSREIVLDRWAKNLSEAGVNMERAPGVELMNVEGEKGNFRLKLKDGRTIEAANVVLAIGTSGNPRRFAVKGEDLPFIKFHLPDASEYCEKTCVVVGVGDAGIEDVLSLARHDNDVIVINTFEGFPLAKAANRGAIEAAIAQGEVKQYTFTTVEGFEEGGIWLNTREEPFYQFPAPPPKPELNFFVECDLVVGRLGALPPRKFLESIGVQFESEHREAMPRVSDTCESTKPGIYLVGALAGRPLIKHAMNQGYEVVQHIRGKPVVVAEMPLLRERLSNLNGSVEDVVERIRKTIPIFGGLSRMQVQELLVESEVHVMKKGQAVFQRDDFSNTFYTILEGSVVVDTERSGEDEDVEAIVPFEAGDFFGEASLLSGRVRTATIRTASPSILIETQRGAMLRLIKSHPDISQTINRQAIKVRLDSLFPQLPREEKDALAAACMIETFRSGQVLFEEGDESDGLHVIRRGSVVITRERDGQKTVLNHMRAGEYLGEVALMRPSMLRSATVTAKVLTETIRIPTKTLIQLTQRRPELRAEFERLSRERLVRDERVLANPGSAQMADFLIDKGGKEATDLLVIDESLCIRCDNCEKACKETHQGLSRLDREAGPRYAGVHLPTACQHCENPLCMTDCPPNALRRDPSGEVYILDTCIGCGNCAGYCPYGVIKMKPVNEPRRSNLLLSLLFGLKRSTEQPHGGDGHELAVKCDLCRAVPGVATGERTVACVSSCPTGAIVRIHPVDFVEEIFDQARGDGRCPSCGRTH